MPRPCAPRWCLSDPHPSTCRYLGAGRSTHGVALLGPDNASIAKDPSWVIR